MEKRVFCIDGPAEKVEKAVNDFLGSLSGAAYDLTISPSAAGFSAVVVYWKDAAAQLDEFKQLIEYPPFCRAGCPKCLPDVNVGGRCDLTGELNGQFKRMCAFGLVDYVKNGGAF